LIYFFFRSHVGWFLSASNGLFKWFRESRSIYLLNWNINSQDSGGSSCFTFSLDLSCKFKIYSSLGGFAGFLGLGCKITISAGLSSGFNGFLGSSSKFTISSGLDSDLVGFLGFGCCRILPCLLLFGFSSFSLSLFLFLHLIHLLFQPSSLIFINCSVNLNLFLLAYLFLLLNN